jgi:hypothetical protein
MKISIVVLLVCLAGLACAQTRTGMTGMPGMGGAAAGGNNIRQALALRMLSGRGQPMNPALQMMMLSQGMFESPMEMMACRTMSPLCLMMLNR